MFIHLSCTLLKGGKPCKFFSFFKSQNCSGNWTKSGEDKIVSDTQAFDNRYHTFHQWIFPVQAFQLKLAAWTRTSRVVYLFRKQQKHLSKEYACNQCPAPQTCSKRKRCRNKQWWNEGRQGFLLPCVILWPPVTVPACRQGSFRSFKRKSLWLPCN